MLTSLEGRLKSTGMTMLDIVKEANHYDDPTLPPDQPQHGAPRPCPDGIAAPPARRRARGVREGGSRSRRASAADRGRLVARDAPTADLLSRPGFTRRAASSRAEVDERGWAPRAEGRGERRAVGGRLSHIGGARTRLKKEDLLQSKIRSSHWYRYMYSLSKYRQIYSVPQNVRQDT